MYCTIIIWYDYNSDIIISNIIISLLLLLLTNCEDVHDDIWWQWLIDCDELIMILG